MGSVVTYWSGRSPHLSAQAELLAYLSKLAAVSDGRLRRQTVSDPGWLAAQAADRESPTGPKPTNIVCFDDVLSGRIVIGSSMLLLDQLVESSQPTAQLVPVRDSWPANTSKACCAIFSRSDQQHYAIELPAFRLHGMAFRIYDPRRLFPNADRMSFAFIQAPQFPELDGQIVHAYSRLECATMDGALVQQADWYLETPSLQLQTYLEEWFDLLMAWIKIFFVPNLEYWRDRVLNRFDEIKESIDRLILSEGPEVAKQAVFEFILESFDDEAQHWEAAIARMADEQA